MTMDEVESGDGGGRMLVGGRMGPFIITDTKAVLVPFSSKLHVLMLALFLHSYPATLPFLFLVLLSTNKHHPKGVFFSVVN